VGRSGEEWERPAKSASTDDALFFFLVDLARLDTGPIALLSFDATIRPIAGLLSYKSLLWPFLQLRSLFLFANAGRSVVGTCGRCSVALESV